MNTRYDVQRMAFLGFGVGFLELVRSAFLIYSFKLEYSHFLEILTYPILFVGLPHLGSQIFSEKKQFVEGSRDARAEVPPNFLQWSHHCLVLLAACSAIPFFYERLLFLDELRIPAALIGSLLVGGILWWGGRKEILGHRLFEFLCLFVYLISSDGDISIARAVMTNDFSWNLGVRWTVLYFLMGAWLSMLIFASRYPRVLLAVVGVVVGLFSVLAYYQPSVHPTGEVSKGVKGDVVLVVFDAMRGDYHEFVNANDPAGGPLTHFKALEARGLTFRNAHSASIVTHDTMPKLLHFTGQQRLLRYGFGRNERRWRDSLPGRLQSVGYEAHLLTDYANQYVRGYDALDWDSISTIRNRHLRLLNLPSYIAAVLQGRSGYLKVWRRYSHASLTEKPILEQFQTQFASKSSQPRLFVLHFGTPHQPYGYPPYQHSNLPEHFDPDEQDYHYTRHIYNATPEEIAMFERDYAYALRAADEVLGTVMETMARYGLPNHDLLIVTSDHGEVFWDRTQPALGHGRHFYQTSHHVPLVMAGPSIAPKIRHELVSQIRIPDTVYDVLGMHEYVQNSLRQETAFDASQFQISFDDRGGVAQRGKWRIIWSDNQTHLSKSDWGHKEPIELYDLERDPGETTNVIRQFPNMARELIKQIGITLPPASKAALDALVTPTP